jgi:hypothetical protein
MAPFLCLRTDKARAIGRQKHEKIEKNERTTGSMNIRASARWRRADRVRRSIHFPECAAGAQKVDLAMPNHSQDEENLDVLVLLCGLRETWKEARRAKASERRAAKAAAKQKAAGAPSRWASQAARALAPVKRPGAAIKAAATRTRELCLLAVGALRAHAGAFAFFLCLWALSAVASATAAAVFSASDEWIAVDTVASGASAAQVNALLSGSAAYSIEQGPRVYREKTAFYDSFAAAAPNCFAAGACEEINLDWRGWMRWATSGEPPAELAKMGWKKESAWSAFGALFPLARAGLCLTLGLSLFLAVFFRKANQAARAESNVFALARFLFLARVSMIAGLSVAGLACALWLALGAWSAVAAARGDGSAAPSWATMEAVVSGHTRPEDAMMLSGEASARDSAADKDQALIQRCVARGYCAPKFAAEREEKGQVSAETAAHRKAARKAMLEQKAWGAWAFCWPLQAIAIALWVSMIFLSMDLERSECSKIESAIQQWRLRGQPRVERAKLLAQAKKGQQASRAQARAGDDGAAKTAAKKAKAL